MGHGSARITRHLDLASSALVAVGGGHAWPLSAGFVFDLGGMLCRIGGAENQLYRRGFYLVVT